LPALKPKIPMDVFKAAHALQKEQRMVIKMGKDYAIPSGNATITDEELTNLYRDLYNFEPDFLDWQTYRAAKQKFNVIWPAEHCPGLIKLNKNIKNK
jgi:hypothetical protein